MNDADEGHVGLAVPSALVEEIRALLHAARSTAARQVNALLVRTHYEIGRRIVLHEQAGEARAEYGKGLLKTLSAQLTAEFGRGYSVRNLELMRQFFLTFRDRAEISQTRFSNSSGDASRSSTPPQFALSWSHYLFLMGIENEAERSFYEIEAANAGWSLRELRRQFDTSLYERLALSRDKEGVRALAAEGQVVARPEHLLKDPYVLEFLGLEARPGYSESDLETAIIDQLEHFLLELGKGFLFEGRQQMYVNYYDRHVKLPEEHPTVGIILCKKKHDALVEITLPEGANIHAREYRHYLPSKAELRRKLMEWTEGEDVP